MHDSLRLDRSPGRRSRTGPVIALGLAALLLGSGSMHAQGLIDGFMRGGGNVTAALSYSHESYSQYFVGNELAKNPLTGEAPDPSNTGLGSISTQSIGLYAACGIIDDIDVIAAVPYVMVHADAGYWADQNDLQDISLAAKWRPLQLEAGGIRLDFIVAAGISFPASNYVNDAPVAVGHGSTNGEGRLLLHAEHNLGPFITLNGGYIGRSEVTLDKGFDVNVPDAVDVSAKAGYSSSLLTAGVWINRQNAQSGRDIAPSATFPSQAVSFTRVGADVYLPLGMVLDGLGVSVGGATTLEGRNVGKSTRFSGGIVYSHKFF